MRKTRCLYCMMNPFLGACYGSLWPTTSWRATLSADCPSMYNMDSIHSLADSQTVLFPSPWLISKSSDYNFFFLPCSTDKQSCMFDEAQHQTRIFTNNVNKNISRGRPSHTRTLGPPDCDGRRRLLVVLPRSANGSRLRIRVPPPLARSTGHATSRLAPFSLSRALT